MLSCSVYFVVERKSQLMSFILSCTEILLSAFYTWVESRWPTKANSGAALSVCSTLCPGTSRSSQLLTCQFYAQVFSPDFLKFSQWTSWGVSKGRAPLPWSYGISGFRQCLWLDRLSAWVIFYLSAMIWELLVPHDFMRLSRKYILGPTFTFWPHLDSTQ